MTKIKLKPKTLEVDSDGVFESEVVPIGNGAMIKFKKEYIGRKVYVVLKNEKY